MKAKAAFLIALFLIGIFAVANEEELQSPLTLTPVGSPVPGKAPLPISVASVSNRLILIGEYGGKNLTLWDLDAATGNLTAEGTARVQKGTSDITTVTTASGTFVFASNILHDDVDSLELEPGTGALKPIGRTHSGGVGPVALGVVNTGGTNYVLSANRDSANLGVLRLDPATGVLAPVGNTPLPPDPVDLKTAGDRVIVGTSSGYIAMARIDRTGFLTPVDVEYYSGQQITAMAVKGNRLAAATAAGEIWTLKIGTNSLDLLARNQLGKGYISDVAFSKKNTLFAVGASPGWLAAYKFPKNGSLSLRAEYSITGQSQRTIATVKGDEKGETFVIMTEFHLNQTQVFRAKR